ncbi:hypothetical protein VB713_17910 [Anabaena cylindrica UHCC 0172]|uniref:hypothetical protein n=1 Tax=Anabaena cylindrica TaxID=1165 RepID=UPI002B206CD9|nr:hypothetical protein [Anabaena cylindrica]MEA5552822.1 hypothetical protein [Anabaena cylindrica UHCC 0172]
MTKTKEYDKRNDQIAELLQESIKNLGPELIANPELAEILNRKIDEQVNEFYATQNGKDAPVDGGLADLIGLGKDAPAELGETHISRGVVDYDDTVTSDRILATADLYYLYIHERLGVFRVINKLQELFKAGTLRISSGEGAYGLYRFDKHNILRYHQRDRMQAYRRVFGYTRANPSNGARPNTQFHGLFTHFIGESAKYWRDKRVSEVIRERANDPTFGSVAIVRRAGLDLRNNMKNASYGYINVLRVETSQALAEAFKVLNSPDLKAQFGADNAWDMIELVLWQYFHESVHASTMNRMAVSGREIIRWLAEPFVLQKNRTDFETLLYRIAEYSEEWLSSMEGMQMTRPSPPPRQVYMQGSPRSSARPDPVFGRSNGLMPGSKVMG